jgi:hypothetical protein
MEHILKCQIDTYFRHVNFLNLLMLLNSSYTWARFISVIAIDCTQAAVNDKHSTQKLIIIKILNGSLPADADNNS